MAVIIVELVCTIGHEERCLLSWRVPIASLSALTLLAMFTYICDTICENVSKRAA